MGFTVVQWFRYIKQSFDAQAENRHGFLTSGSFKRSVPKKPPRKSGVFIQTHYWFKPLLNLRFVTLCDIFLKNSGGFRDMSRLPRKHLQKRGDEANEIFCKAFGSSDHNRPDPIGLG
jgi:hypothetical protein